MCYRQPWPICFVRSVITLSILLSIVIHPDCSNIYTGFRQLDDDPVGADTILVIGSSDGEYPWTILWGHVNDIYINTIYISATVTRWVKICREI